MKYQDTSLDRLEDLRQDREHQTTVSTGHGWRDRVDLNVDLGRMMGETRGERVESRGLGC